MATQPVPVIPMVRPMETQEVGLPDELKEKLKAPLPAEAIKPHPRMKNLSSINAAFVIERMNEVFGPGAYQERYREISVTTKEEKRKEKDEHGNPTGREYPVTLFVATVHGSLTIPRYGIHLENFGGSENLDAGDALKGGCTDAFTKMCSHLGIGLAVYKSGRENKADDLPACPECRKTGTIIKGKAEYGGGYVCYMKKQGCGAKFNDAEMEQLKSGKTSGKPETAAKPPQSAQQPRTQAQASSTTNGNVGKFPLKGTVTDRHTERKDGENIFWLTVGDKQCATKQPDVMNQLAKAFKGTQVEMLVTRLSGKDGEIFQIREVIRVTPPQEGGRQ